MGFVNSKHGQADLPTSQSTKVFWLQDPSQELLGHRTTETPPEAMDIVIIGSGIAGAFAARELLASAKSDTTTVMLEAREACWGATGRVSWSFIAVILMLGLQ